MTSLFISYSRKDIDLARKLTEAFKGQDLDFWIDWEDIPPTVDWWKEIEKGIEEADIFLFLISPDSAASNVCKQEIEHAAKNGKRLIPLVIRDIKGDEAPAELGHLNWIFLRTNDDFESAFNKLLDAIKTDYAWVQTHRQLQVKALEWERNNREQSFLLRGKELQDAEVQLATNSSREPHPTDLQRDYVLQSRQATDRQRRITTSISIAGVIVLAALAIFGFVQAGLARNAQATAEANLYVAQTAQVEAQNKEAARATQQALAEERAKIARAGELATLSQSVRDTQVDLASLLGLEAYRTWDFLRSRAALINNLTTNPHLHQFLPQYNGWVSGLAFNPQTGELASAGCIQQIGLDCLDYGISIWRLNQGDLKEVTTVSHAATNTLAYNATGSILATGGCVAPGDFQCLRSEIILWDTETYQPIGNSLSGVPSNIQSLVFSSDRKFLIGAGCLDTSLNNCSEPVLQVWDLQTRSPVGEPLPMDSGIVNLSFSPTSQTLASSGWDGVVTLWKFQNGRLLEPTPIPMSMFEGFPHIAFSPDGKTLISGGTDNILRLWDVETGQLLHEFPGHDDDIYAVAYSPDGKFLASGSVDNTVIIWNREYEVPVQTLRGHANDVIQLAFSLDGKFLVSADRDGQILEWDVQDDLPLGESQPISGFTLLHAEFDPTDKVVTVDLKDGEIVVSTADRTLPIGKPIQDFPEGFSSHLALTPDQQAIALGGRGLITIMDLTSSQPLLNQPITGQSEYVTSLAFSPDGQTLASGGCYNRNEDGVCPTGIIYLWNANTGVQLGDPIIGHTSWVQSLAFSPDGKTLASGSVDNTILLWDLSKREVVGIPFVGHHDQVNGLSFSPDGTLLASAAENGEVFLWDVATHQRIGSLNQNGSFYDLVRGIAFSPDGRHLISSDYDGHVMLWEVAPGDWAQKTCQRVGRNFTRAEWSYYFPNEEYRKTCEQWPLEPELLSNPVPTP